jgi:hypothetical protein
LSAFWQHFCAFYAIFWRSTSCRSTRWRSTRLAFHEIDVPRDVIPRGVVPRAGVPRDVVPRDVVPRAVVPRIAVVPKLRTILQSNHNFKLLQLFPTAEQIHARGFSGGGKGIHA